MIMKNNYLCICGHRKARHHNTYVRETPITYCFHCLCRKFKLDNLKYLEMIYEENVK